MEIGMHVRQHDIRAIGKGGGRRFKASCIYLGFCPGRTLGLVLGDLVPYRYR